ncbi:hypothetical protein VKT23_011453 [Stygiomarasmius scandens]|uniref:Uncharacterized protein n=1 Tax=Marasmiellus scandens TaxID=2682957 RepID=A0ABR1JDD4_9AGAR
MIPTTLLLVATVCLLNMRLASASIYPTKPIQGTTYTVDQCDLIEWKNTRQAPRCEGPVVIDLHVADDRMPATDSYVATVGKFSPNDKEAEFCPPANLRYRGSEYVFRFYCSNLPHDPIYTHDFSILGTAPSPYNAAFAHNSTRVATTATISTMTSPLSTTTSYVLASTTSTVYADSVDPSGHDEYRRKRPYYPNSARKNGIDMEKLKFRLVFIVWPALVGISMSL